MPLFQTRDNTLLPASIARIAGAYGYSAFEVKNMTTELRQSMLKAIAEDAEKGIVITPIVRPEQAITEEKVSFFANLKKELKERSLELAATIKRSLPAIGAGLAVVVIVGVFVYAKGKG